MSAFDVTLAASARTLAIATRRRLDWWARSFAGLRQPAVMAAPPTVSYVNSNTSSINASVVNGVGTGITPANSTRLAYAGATPVWDAANNRATFTGLTQSNGTAGAPPLWRVRFMTDAPTFEVAVRDGQQTTLNAVIDGEWLIRQSPAIQMLPTSGAVHYVKFDFGADTTSYGIGNFNFTTATNYSTNDVLTVVGGTYTRPAKLRLTSANAAGVYGVAVEDSGDYSVLPSFPAATTGGTGSGLTVTASSVITPRHTTRRMRTIELLFTAQNGNFGFHGIVTTANDLVLAAPFNPRTPKLLVVGDSQSAGTYLDYAGGQAPVTMAERLGLRDRLVLNAKGGTGWISASGGIGGFADPYRVADYIREAPDLILFDGSQNDGSSNNAAVTTAVASTLQQVQAALPAVRIILVGPVYAGQASYMAALAAGVALAPEQRRVRLIDNVAEGWHFNDKRYVDTVKYLASDGQHLGQHAIDEVRSVIMARRVASAVQEMVDG